MIGGLTLVVGGLIQGPIIAHGQQAPTDPNTEAAVTGSTVYRSEIDELLTVRKIAVLPFSDNVNGIYSRPLETHIISTLKKNHRWDYVEANSVGPIATPDELESSTEMVKNMNSGLGADALLACRITKGPKGITIKLDLFLTKDGKLLAQSELQDLNRFELDEVKEKSSELLAQVTTKIPYNGVILSRQGNRVTVSIGKRDGIEPGQIVTVIQIIKATRHPKFNFLINTETEILGKVKLVKVDETLSFGQILNEKGKGTIQRMAKISGIEFVTYAGGNEWTADQGQDSLMERPDSLITFGKGAQEWIPKKPPTFGQVGARLGLGMYNGNMQLDNENLDADNPYYPSISLEGELWITPKWTMHATIKQGIISIDNPKSGTGTSKLSQSLSSYDLLVGYTMRFGPSVWGPRVELLGGYSMYRLFVDDTKDTLGNHGLTTLQYNGLKLGLMGAYPVTNDLLWSAGAKLFFFWKPTVNESPISSGTKEATVNQFGFFAERKISENIKAQGSLDYELYSTEFSGGRASSASHTHTTLSAALFYMF